MQNGALVRRFVFAIWILGMGALPGGLLAATYNVPDGNVGALIAAIVSAAYSDGEDTIELAPNGEYVLTGINSNDIPPYGNNGLPFVNSDIIINGNGATIRRDSSVGVPPFRIFTVLYGAKLTLNNVEILNGQLVANDYDAGSGGNILSRGTLVLNGSTIANGWAYYYGGGIYASGPVTATNCTISNNFALDSGGGVYAKGNVSLLNSVLTQNTGSNSGGGIFMDVDIPFTYQNSIIAGNTAVSGADCYSNASVNNGNNLLGASGSCQAGGSDFVTANVAAELDTTLADNGGPTRTHALLQGSIAIDHGNDAGAPSTDQRGFTRVDGDGNGTVVSDIGSYEFVSYLVNGSFEKDDDANFLPDSWTAKGMNPGATGDRRDCTAATDGTCSMLIKGNGSTKKLYQDVNLSGDAGSSYSLVFSYQSDAVTGAGTNRLLLAIYYTDGSVEKFKLDLPSGTNAWSNYSLPASAARQFQKIRVQFQYSRSSGTVWFDKVRLDPH